MSLINSIPLNTAVTILPAVTVDIQNGGSFALPIGTSLLVWQTVYGTAPDSITVQLQVSLNNTDWTTIDSTTVVGGATRSIVNGSTFVRARINAVSGGTTASVIIVARNIAIGAALLTSLTDTDISAPSDEQVLSYDAGTQKWINATGSGGGFPDATYLTSDDETGDLPNSRALVAGTNVTIDDSTPGELEISASGGGGALPGNHLMLYDNAGAIGGFGYYQASGPEINFFTGQLYIQPTGIDAIFVVNADPGSQGEIKFNFQGIGTAWRLNMDSAGLLTLYNSANQSVYSCVAGSRELQVAEIALTKIIAALPTSDPEVVGQLWSNLGIVTVSEG